jgi:hypothetical protein
MGVNMLQSIINRGLRLREGVIIVLALTGGAIAPFLGMVGTAHAAYSCPLGLVCIYDADGGNGTRYAFGGTQGVCTNVPTYANDMANSYKNMFTNTDGYPRHVSFYPDANCQGYRLQAAGTNAPPVPYTGYGTFPYKNSGCCQFDNRNKVTSYFFHNY